MMDDSKLVFIPEAHEYRYDTGDGVVSLPSVSKIIEVVTGAVPKLPHIMRAAEFGTLVHNLTAHVDTGSDILIPEADERAERYVEQWERATEELGFDGFDTVGIELQVMHYDDEYEFGFAGTVDRVYYDRESKTAYIVDIKTGKPYPKHGLQLAAYQYLCDVDTVGERVEEWKRMCVYLREDSYASHTFTNDLDFIGFWGAVDVYRWKKENGLIE